MKATFLGLPTDNVLLPVAVMGAVILVCFGISVTYFKWE
jgi:ABC-2 type transport system permease protein